RMLRAAQSRTVGTGAGRLRRVGSGAASGRVTDSRQHAGGALRGRARQGEGESAGRVDSAGRRRLHRTVERAGQPVAAAGVRLHRVLAMHPPDQGRGGSTGRPMATVRQDRMRTAHMSGAGAVVLVAHGSRHPKAALTTHALARAVSAARPGLDVHTAYLDHAGPRPGAVLAELDAAGVPSATVVPLLLTSAYHGKVDLPAALASAREEGVRLPVRRTDVLGPVAGQVPPALLAGLRRRLDELGVDYDAVALLAAGTRDTAARRTVHEAA